MRDWFLRLIGLDPERLQTGAGEEVEFSWANMPESVGVFVLIGAVLLIGVVVVLLYLREIDTCPRGVKLFLAGLRFLVLLMLVVIFLGPELRYTETKATAKDVFILRDASTSMNQPDTYQHLDDDGQTAEVVAEVTGRSVSDIQEKGVTRVEILNSLVEKDHFQLIEELRRRAKVRVLDFSKRVGEDSQFFEEIQQDDENAEQDAAASPGGDEDDSENTAQSGNEVSPLKAGGVATDIIRAVHELSGHGPAAIVVLTDGQQTAGGDLVEAGYYARKKGVRLYIVGIGDPSRPRNLEVVEVYVRPKVWPDEPFEVTAMLTAKGVGAVDVGVELFEQKLSESDGQPGPSRMVKSKRVTLPERGGTMRVSFKDHAIASPGKYIYTVKVEELPKELRLDDNSKVRGSPLEVVNEKVNVLLIAGAPTWEYRMVQRLLTRDQTIGVSCWLQTLDPERPQEGDLPISKLPLTPEELAEYHVVMMFDPNPDEFDANWIEMLKNFVSEQAGGVLYMAGPKYTGLFLSLKRTDSLKDIMPVKFGDVAETEVALRLTTNSEAWPLRVVTQNLDHPIMEFGEESGRTRDLWKEFPGIFWSFPSAGAKPTTEVLIEHSDSTLPDAPRPLMVTGRYGAGNTVFLGFNGTWRWRSIGRQAEYFDRFWTKVIRFLVETRSLQNRRRGFVQSEKPDYEIGEKIVVTARLLDPFYKPITATQIEGKVESASNTGTPVLFQQTNKEGDYQTTFEVEEIGEHTISVELPGAAGGDPETIEATFNVLLPQVEQKSIWLDEAALRKTAAASGGAYFNINEVGKLAAAIPNTIEFVDVPGDTPEPLWDIRGVLVLFTILLGVEWAVRKGFKLL